MKRYLLWSLVAINVIACSIANGSEEICQDHPEVSYCHKFTAYCDLKSIAEKCPKTCNLCTTSTPNTTDCDSLKCEHICSSPGANKDPECICRTGYKLLEDGRSCQDIDECARENPCPGNKYDCVNTVGSYRCEGKCGSNEFKYYKISKCCEASQAEAEFCGLNSENGGPKQRGDRARVTRWPWMAFITFQSSMKSCAGILVSRSWVLVAAHCVSGRKPDDINLMFGIVSNDVDSRLNKDLQKRVAESIFIHPSYNYPYDDLALIRLKKDVALTDYVRPNCLPRDENPAAGQNCWALGYERRPVNWSNIWSVLQQETVTVSERKKCRGIDAGNGNGLMCISHADRQALDDCQGGTGGPLVCQRCSSCGWYVAGFASKGVSCKIRKPPLSNFTRVSHHETWIRKTMGLAGVRSSGVPSCKPPRKFTDWSSWGSWSGCSVTCGNGTSQQIRICRSIERGTRGCQGDDKRTRPCTRKPCKSECGDWGSWSDCSVTCNLGTQRRSRVCISGSTHLTEISRICMSEPCPPSWSKWTDWSTCSASCGGGIKTRERRCTGRIFATGCKGPSVLRESCNDMQCPNEGWADWSSWSACDATCGTGLKSRYRTCKQRKCRGSDTERRLCTAEPCTKIDKCDQYTDLWPDYCRNPAICASAESWWNCGRTCCGEYRKYVYSKWSDWSSCTAKCDGGWQERRRRCLDRSWCDEFFQENLREVRACNKRSCSARASEPLCSASCGGGLRKRQCLEGECSEGQTFLTEHCNTEPCLGDISEWSTWTDCSTTCGNGTRERTRNCTGGSCTNETLYETEQCHLNDCGVWSPWKYTEPCSVTCGLGSITKTRTCLSGSCDGNSEEKELCVGSDCPTVPENSECHDDPTMKTICPLLKGNCNNGYMTFACRKSCGIC